MLSVKATLQAPSEGGEKVTRRFVADPAVISCYAGLAAKLTNIFPGLTLDNFNVYWTDCDGDQVIISTDEEAQLALASQEQSGTVNFIIRDTGSASVQHPGVVCDGCEGAIYGRRFKCSVCFDYDLCSACDGKGVHTQHPMVRIATPRERPFAFHQQAPFFGIAASSESCPRFRPRPCPSAYNKLCGGLGAESMFIPLGFENFDTMAKTMMENWAEAMGQTHDAAEKKNRDENQEDENKKSDEPLDAHAFSAMIEEISENFKEVLGNLGGKRKKSPDQREGKSIGEEPKQKQGRQGCCMQGDDRGGSFDFEKLAEVMGPLVANVLGNLGQAFDPAENSACFAEGMQGAGNGQENKKDKKPNCESPKAEKKTEQKQDNGERPSGEYSETKAKPEQKHEQNEAFENNPRMSALHNFLGGLQNVHQQHTHNAHQQHAAAAAAHAAAARDAASSINGGADANTAGGPADLNPQNLHHMMSSFMNQFGVTHEHVHDMFGQSSQQQPRHGHSATVNATTGQQKSSSAQPQSKRFQFMNPENTETSPSNSFATATFGQNDARIARSLAQLKAMGFSDDGGWLTALLREKNGDVGRVLDVILSSRM